MIRVPTQTLVYTELSALHKPPYFLSHRDSDFSAAALAAVRFAWNFTFTCASCRRRGRGNIEKKFNNTDIIEDRSLSVCSQMLAFRSVQKAMTNY